MLNRKYILLMDKGDSDPQLIDYFAKFDFDIKQISGFESLNSVNAGNASALLINSHFFEGNFSGCISKIYQEYTIPIVILSETSNEKLCVHLLEAGADEFLVKPVHPRELHARITAISRRLCPIKEAEHEKNVFSFAGWRLYPHSRQLFDSQQKELNLSISEYDLLLAFVRQSQSVLKRDFLMQFIKSGGNNTVLTDRRIDVQISRLRQKIEIDPKHPKLIKTIRKGGYLFTAAVSKSSVSG